MALLTALDADKTIRIRSYTPVDLPVVVELFTLYYADSGEHSDGVRQIWYDYIDHSVRDDLADLEGTYFASGGHFWVATSVADDGKAAIVGTVGLEGKPGKVFELRRMSVRLGFHRSGIGKQLVAHLEQWARDHSIPKICLSTAGLMTQARNFYVKLGYAQTNVDVLSEDPYFPVVFYEKALVRVASKFALDSNSKVW